MKSLCAVVQMEVQTLHGIFDPLLVVVDMSSSSSSSSSPSDKMKIKD